GRRLQQLIENEPVEQGEQLRRVAAGVPAARGRQELLEQQQVLAPDLVEGELKARPPPRLEEELVACEREARSLRGEPAPNQLGAQLRRPPGLVRAVRDERLHRLHRGALEIDQAQQRCGQQRLAGLEVV